MQSQEVPISIGNPSALLNQIAQLYSSLDRAIMEYIDNSFDSADAFYNEDRLKYDKENLRIQIKINRKASKIVIVDNCTGMTKDKLISLASEISKSDKALQKKRRPWVNGQFGYGIHAFRAFAKSLTISSKQHNSNTYSITFSRDKNSALFDQARKEIDNTGTEIIIGEINRSDLKLLNAKELKEKIEDHFELLLDRNIEIIIRDETINYHCQQYNYDSIDGQEFKKQITEIADQKSLFKTKFDNWPINIRLKVSLTIPVNRPPYFALKGRKIADICSIRSFVASTKYRTKVWANKYLTGYIDLGNSLDPVLTRDDFKREDRTAVYNEILKLEPELYQWLEEINNVNREKSLDKFAGVLSEILEDLAKKDQINLRISDGQHNNNKEKVSLSESGEITIKVPSQEPTPEGDKDPIKNRKTEEKTATPNPIGDKEAKTTSRKSPPIGFDRSDIEHMQNKKGFFDGGFIRIYVKHPEFIKRVSNTRESELGSLKINERLITYLASVISSIYKEIFYQNNKKIQPTRDVILEQQADFILRFEELLQAYLNKSLNSIE